MSEPTTTPDKDQVISPELQAMLVCPIDKAALDLRGSALICTQCGRAYPIENGIPNMLVDEAR